MENKVVTIGTLVERVENYTKTSVELLKLKTLDKSVSITTSFASSFFIFVVVTLFFIFLSFGLSYWIGDLLGKIHYGFFVIAGVYVFLGLVTYFFRDKLIKIPLGNSLINQILK